ncbi:MAG: hypothetical protein ACLUR5_19015 [Eubacterium ventriosum]
MKQRIVVLPDSVDKAKKIIEDTFAEIKEEYRVTDPDANLTLNVREADMVDAFTDVTTLATIIAMVNMPNGVQRMNPEIDGFSTDIT